jgi:preprotein translocase YajC subunit
MRLPNFLAADGFDPTIIVLIVVLVLFVVFMFVMPIFTKRKNGQVPELYANLEVGDKVMTIGGIIGTVLEIKEKTPTDKEILIESGAEGSKTSLWLDIKGLYQNLTKPPQPTNFFGRPKNPVKPDEVVAEPVIEDVATEPEPQAEATETPADPFTPDVAEPQAEPEVTAEPEVAAEPEVKEELTAPAAKTAPAGSTRKKK